MSLFDSRVLKIIFIIAKQICQRDNYILCGIFFDIRCHDIADLLFYNYKIAIFVKNNINISLWNIR